MRNKTKINMLPSKGLRPELAPVLLPILTRVPKSGRLFLGEGDLQKATAEAVVAPSPKRRRRQGGSVRWADGLSAI